MCEYLAGILYILQRQITKSGLEQEQWSRRGFRETWCLSGVSFCIITLARGIVCRAWCILVLLFFYPIATHGPVSSRRPSLAGVWFLFKRFSFQYRPDRTVHFWLYHKTGSPIYSRCLTYHPESATNILSASDCSWIIFRVGKCKLL